MLKKVVFGVTLFGVAAGAVFSAGAQGPPPRGARATAPPKAAAPKTPAQEARDEWNRGAVAYRTGKYADAQRHFERVRQLDPQFKDVRLYIARSLAQQYRTGPDGAENPAKGEEAVAAYEALLADEPANDDAFRGLVALLTQMRAPERVRDAVLRRANDDALPAPKRVEALMSVSTPELKCSQAVTGRPENREMGGEQGARRVVKYKMPADTGEFYRAQQCATAGLGYVDHALQIAPEDAKALGQRLGFLNELAILSDMEGNTGQKDFYRSQQAEVMERLRALGVTPPPAQVVGGKPESGGDGDGAPDPARGENAAGPDLPVGVAECDQYITAYQVCVMEKVPEGQRATVQASLNRMRANWRRTAATPEGREGLAQTCRAAREQARQTFSAYGCIF